MKKYFEVLRKCALFKNINDENIFAVLGCLGAKEQIFKKGCTILAEGETAKKFGIVLSGQAQIERVDYYGNRSILTSVYPSEIFGESFACAGIQKMPVNVIATEETVALLIDAEKIAKTCSNSCGFHNQMIFNLLNIVSTKNLLFHQKIEITSKRTTREKLMTYLLIQAKNSGSNTFSIPFDRQELADYLEVERSGLSSEIGKLRKEKLIICKKSTFTLLN